MYLIIHPLSCGLLCLLYKKMVMPLDDSRKSALRDDSPYILVFRELAVCRVAYNACDLMDWTNPTLFFDHFL